MKLHEIAVAAMKAGLRGIPLPNLGRLTTEQLALVNTVYEEARNWAAGVAVHVSGA